MVAVRRTAYTEESAEVEVLFANMEKLKGLTKKIQGSLNRLEASGKSVQDAISPIYGNTSRLQVANRNVDLLLEVIDRIREPLDQRGQEERIIRSDPRKIGIQEYVASLDRATRALADLRGSNLKSNQKAIQELTDLLRHGSKQLEYVFRDILKEETSRIEPLNFIVKGRSFPIISTERASRLQMINSYVLASFQQMSTETAQGTPTAKAYADVRGGYITQSLETLAAASVSTAKKTDASAIYKPGSNGFATYVSALEGMAFQEWQSICNIFEPQEHDKVCIMTCDRPIKAYKNTLGELREHIKSHMITDSYLAFEILEVVMKLVGRLRGRIPVLEQPILDATKGIREIAKASIPRLLEETKNKVQAIPVLSTDGAAVPVTTEVMTHLQTMTAFIKPVSAVLSSLGDGAWSSAAGSPAASTTSFQPSLKSVDIGGEGGELFPRYVADIVDTLLSSLESRARLLLKGGSVQGVFMMNNIAIVDRMIRSCELANFLAVLSPKLEQWRKKSSAKYVDAWKELSAQLLDVQYTSRSARPPSGGGQPDSAAVIKSLGSKEKDGIKEKFKNFNFGFDDLVSKHKGYKMEREVRTQLTKEIQGYIEPLYGRFWDRYHEIDKGKGKYVKYDKGQVSASLASLA